MQTMYTLTSITQGAQEWVSNNLSYKPYQQIGEGIVIEHRYIADIMAGLIEEGFLPNKDFRVS